MIDKDFCTETKVVGVTKNNDHNIPIQSLLPSLKEGDRIILIRDYGNDYDENAIQVYARIEQRLEHIGYLSASLAENISPFLEENPKYDIEGVVRCITGGADGKSYGCNITIWIQDPDEPSFEELHAFAKSYTPEDQTWTTSAVNDTSNKHIWIIAFLICVIVFFIILSVINASLNIKNPDDVDASATGESSQQSSQERGIDEHLITLNEYNQLRSGMYRSEVYDIIGSFGEKLSETGNASDDYHIEMYSYEGYGDTGANAQLMFVNGKLDTMAQYGLESYYGKEYGGENIDESVNSSQKTSSSISSQKDSYWSEADTSSHEISSSISSIHQSDTSRNESSSIDTSSSIFSASEDEVLVKVTDINLNTSILPPNSIGTVWMEAAYTNNSNYAISSVSYKYLCKDTNETHYLSTYDTVLPGETSPKFDAFGPESGKESDIEFLTCKIVVLDENGDKVFIDYDYKLGTYEMV